MRVLAGLFMCLLASGRTAKPFHAPTTEAERALDKALHKLEEDPQTAADLRKGRNAKTIRGFLTTELFKVLVAVANPGDCVEGELCGLEYDPLVCAQDAALSYFYRTDRETSSEAWIDYAWPSQAKAAATYHLLKLADGWRLDGIECAEGGKFNMR